LPVWDAMRQLGALGLQTVIDDFGTGFSNVSYLLKLAVNRIKIDQTFIACIEQDIGCNAVVSSLISMAHSLGVCVVAEGVETEGQRAILLEKGCDEAQGYLFYQPISLADLRKVLVENVQSDSAVLVNANGQPGEAREWLT
jgi:EAL domain-containing protein (putative c-di-GMP-specific phosphodiesterase class I)